MEWLNLQKDYAELVEQVKALQGLITLAGLPDFMGWAQYYIKMEEARKALEVFCTYKLLHFSDDDYLRTKQILGTLMRANRLAGRQPLLISKGEQWIDHYNASVTGSFIFLDQPTVQILSDDELAGVLAHELGHRQKKHALEYLRFVFEHGWPVTERKWLWEALCHRQEFQADAFAVHAASQAGYRPQGLTAALRKLTARFLEQPSIRLFLSYASGQEGRQEEEDRPQILNTHPSFKARAAAIEREIASLSSPAASVALTVRKPHVQVVLDHGLAFNIWALSGIKGAVLIHADAHADMAVPAPSGWEECADVDLWGLCFEEGNFIYPAVYCGIIDEIYHVIPPHSEGKPSQREMVVNGRRISIHVLRLSDLPDFRREQRPVLVDIDEDYFVEQGNMKSAIYRKVAFGSPRQEIESELKHGIAWFLERLFSVAGVATPLVTIAESPDWVPQKFIPFITQTLKAEINRMLSASRGSVGGGSDSQISSPARAGFPLPMKESPSPARAGFPLPVLVETAARLSFDDTVSAVSRVSVSGVPAFGGGLYSIADFDGRSSWAAQPSKGGASFSDEGRLQPSKGGASFSGLGNLRPGYGEAAAGAIVKIP
jgi:hypothetical protein